MDIDEEQALTLAALTWSLLEDPRERAIVAEIERRQQIFGESFEALFRLAAELGD